MANSTTFFNGGDGVDRYFDTICNIGVGFGYFNHFKIMIYEISTGFGYGKSDYKEAPENYDSPIQSNFTVHSKRCIFYVEPVLGYKIKGYCGFCILFAF
ncbi:MAG: hypothetical protein HC906_19990 [Bacteroidales bacterium]|nr:hypothetical protein [Bacteroidales bacterium]